MFPGFLDVGISVGVVSPQSHPRQMILRGFVQARCQGVGLGRAPGGEAAPAAGVEPILAVSGGVDVDGEENYLIVAELLANGVYAAAALLQGDVFALRNYQLGIEAQGGEAFPDEEGEVAGVGIFAEVAVGAALAGRVKAVAVVEEDLHSCCLDSDSKLGRICGNNYFQEFPLSLQTVSISLDIYKRNRLEVHPKRAFRHFLWNS